MSSFDYIVGGARTVVDALMEICGDGGTILMPTQNIDNSEPSDWQDLTPERYRSLFRGSAVKRAKFEGLRRNIDAVAAEPSDDGTPPQKR